MASSRTSGSASDQAMPPLDNLPSPPCSRASATSTSTPSTVELPAGRPPTTESADVAMAATPGSSRGEDQPVCRGVRDGRRSLDRDAAGVAARSQGPLVAELVGGGEVQRRVAVAGGWSAPGWDPSPACACGSGSPRPGAPCSSRRGPPRGPSCGAFGGGASIRSCPRRSARPPGVPGRRREGARCRINTGVGGVVPWIPSDSAVRLSSRSARVSPAGSCGRGLGSPPGASVCTRSARRPR